MVTVLSKDESTANLNRVEFLDATPWPKDTDNCRVSYCHKFNGGKSEAQRHFIEAE